MPATPPLRVSIVVPTLDEEAALDATLATAAAADESVVSDGGSRDRTLEVERRLGALVVVGTA
jgi:glycosyltransferase involved in cell wall biosynthesis